MQKRIDDYGQVTADQERTSDNGGCPGVSGLAWTGRSSIYLWKK